MTAKRKKQRISKKQRQRIRQRNRNLVLGGMILVLAVLAGVFFLKGDPDKKTPNGENSQKNETVTPTNTPESTPTPTLAPEVVQNVSLDGVDSTSLILVRCDDNAVICEKDADRKLYPASMTKIMTALVAIENITNLSDTLKIKQSTYDEVYLQGASLAGMPCGEDIPIMDVLYGVMLPSGAECCVAIAEYLYGSEEAFVQVMNAKAAELGMDSTHFVTSTGLHDAKHYTTVRDLTKLLQYALENETFKMIYCSKTYTTAPTKKYSEGITFYNTMFARLGDRELENGEILGGKTGYTSEAGNCLASYAVVDGDEYILVTAGSTNESKMGPVQDALLMYNQLGKE